MAPIAPFTADWLHHALTAGGGSVHLEPFPEVDEALRDAGLERRMALARGLASTVLALRNEAGINVRQPLGRMLVVTGVGALIARRPALRKLILDLRHKFEQVVDEVSKDELIADQTGYSPEAREKAAALVHSFEQYLKEHKDEIDALQFFYSVPHRKRLRYADIKALADAARKGGLSF